MSQIATSLNVFGRQFVTVMAQSVIWFFDFGMRLLGPVLICVALGAEPGRPQWHKCRVSRTFLQRLLCVLRAV